MPIRDVSPLLTVTDLDRSCAFYAHLGLRACVQWETYAKLVGDEGGVLHLALPGDPPPDRPTIAMTAPSADLAQGRASGLVVLEVDDCAAAADALTSAGIALISPPTTPPWGGEIRAFAADPDGHLVELNQPLD